MSENCTHNCETCSQKCSQSEAKPNFAAELNEVSSVKHVIGVVSGKGGVGKSLVTSMLATIMNRRGYKTAVLDADITGPSIPRIFGLTQKAKGSKDGILPVATQNGIDVISINLLLPNDTDPVVWRGPVIAGTVKQFWSEVVWKDIDYMFVDMPPGTGDVPLTVFQSLPVEGIVVVTSPQELVSMIVKKAVNMADMMGVPVVGLVQNMSYFECPNCGEKHRIFGNVNAQETARQQGIKTVAELPVSPDLAGLCDKGAIETFEGGWLDGIADVVEKL